MKKTMAMVRDADGNEMFFAETPGECERWCAENNVTGENGEYIAIGTFDEEDKSFEMEDADTINNNLFKEEIIMENMNSAFTFVQDGITYESTATGRFFGTVPGGKKTRIGKKAYEAAFKQYTKSHEITEEEVEEKIEQVEETETTEEIEEVKKEINTDAQKPAVITEHGCVDCRGCNVEGCVHRDCMRRNPTVIGGLGLCPRLQVEVLKEEKPKTKKVNKPKTKKVQVGGMEFDHEGIKILLTPKQVDFIKHLPDTDFWEHGTDSAIWIDCLCDEIGGQFAARPMTVGAMISTLCEKGLGVRAKERVNGRKATSFKLTELGQKIAKELGL